MEFCMDTLSIEPRQNSRMQRLPHLLLIFASAAALSACGGANVQTSTNQQASTPSSTPSGTPANPSPTVALSPSPITVTKGQSAALAWNSTNATACTASGAWSGSMGTSGSKSTGPLSATSEYVLTCTGAGGTATQSATVTVNATSPPPVAAAPAVTISASPASVTSGGSSTLTWSSTNAT